jgi:hypothetical protein
METDGDARTRIAMLLMRRCSNCYRELPGYNVHGRGWNWLTPNVGPFCDECWAEVLTTEPVIRSDE